MKAFASMNQLVSDATLPYLLHDFKLTQLTAFISHWGILLLLSLGIANGKLILP